MRAQTARRRRVDRTSSLPSELKKALAGFEDASRKRFGTDFDTLVRDTNRNQAAARMRYLVGVVMKKEYSDEQKVVNQKGELVDYKWKINDEKLAAMADDAWQIRLLTQAPNRLPGETGKQVAKRLRRETLLQRCYFGVIRPYLCQTQEVRREIKSILKGCGLGEFAPLTSPKALLGVGAAKVCVVLGSTLPAGAVAVTALAICVMGINRICRCREQSKKGRARARKSGGQSQQGSPAV